MRSLVPGLLLAVALGLALALALGVADAQPRPAAPATRPWGWGMQADSLAADSARVARLRAVADSLRRAPTPPGASPARAADDSVRSVMPRVWVAADSARRAARNFAVPDSLRGPTGPFEYLWVVRTSILTPQSVDQIVLRAKEQGVRALLVQVVGRGDAYYRSSLLPRAEALPAGDFDPLDRLVKAAHAESLEVHAWVNCMLVWSAPQPPRNPQHVVRAHPEWVARLKDGRPLSRLSARQRQSLGIEGVFLAPAHPGVRTWVANTAREIVSRYPVDGIHLDYIRQPLAAVGFDPTTRARFALGSGVDPERFRNVPAAERARVDSMWLAFQCEQVRRVVAEVRDSVHAIHPGLPVSAAVIADTITAERHNAQRWRDWLKAGLLDRAFPMCYAPPVQTVMEQLLGYATSMGADSRIVPGISVYNTPPAAAAAKFKGAHALGFSKLALYSYDSLAEQPGYWARLRALVTDLP